MSLYTTILGLYRENRNISPTKLGQLSTEELLELKGIVDTDLAYISSQVDLARSKAVASREFAEPEWFQRATLAKKLKGRFSQAIQTECGKRRRERAAINNQEQMQSFAKRLLLAMDAILTPEQKQKVLDHAKALEEM